MTATITIPAAQQRDVGNPAYRVACREVTDTGAHIFVAAVAAYEQRNADFHASSASHEDAFSMKADLPVVDGADHHLAIGETLVVGGQLELRLLKTTPGAGDGMMGNNGAAIFEVAPV